MKRSYLNTAVKAALLAPAVGLMTPAAMAQESDDNVEVIEVRGIVSSLKRAMSDKKESAIVSDGIAAEDLGKFPDLNVAESLQRITGVSIDREGGEGQQVTVRGLGPQFNQVLVNGRQIANDSAGREFNFDVLSADLITGANVYKSAQAAFQEGGIGATIGVTTARPFDFDGFRATVSAKGMYETLSEETAPQVSGLVSNTWNDGKFGALLSVSYQERDLQINRIETAGWRPGQEISNTVTDADGNRVTNVLASNVYIPRNWDQIVDNQERTRTNANLVFQFAPSDEVTVTLDGFVSKFEVDSVVTDLASWFEPDRVGQVEVDAATNTAVFFTQETGISGSSGDPASDFVSHTRNSRDINNHGFGLNVEWAIKDNLTATFDVNTSEAENDRAGRDRFNVIGIINNYSFDGRGSVPTVAHDGFENGNLPSASLARAHYNERGNRPSSEDEITEFKADFVYLPDSDTFTKMRFGAYRQEREKRSFQDFTSIGCGVYCGYNIDIPDDLIRPFTAQNFFPGLIDTFYAYDGEAYFSYLESDAGLAAADAFRAAQAIANGDVDENGNPIFVSARDAMTNADGSFGHIPQRLGNSYDISEDVTSLYADFEFNYDLGDMPLTVLAGVRYTETSIDVMAIQEFIRDVVPTNDLTLFSNVFEPAVNIVGSDSYSNLLPSINAKLELSDDMILRAAVYDTLTRPTMAELSPATVFGEPRRQNLAASGGNPALNPIEAENWDLSFEWYYDDASAFTVAVFKKDVEGFITTLTGQETYVFGARTAADGFRCASSPLCVPGVSVDPNRPGFDVVANTEELNGQSEVYNVARPQNGLESSITGLEIAWTHVWENGIGVSLNATKVDSDDDTGSTIEGLGDSQNAVLFYERDGFQARIAFNNREGFLRRVDNGFNGEPVNTDTFGQWDISASYDINETFTVFFEGINITEEELVQFGRFDTQVYNIEDNGSRYAVGVRANF